MFHRIIGLNYADYTKELNLIRILKIWEGEKERKKELIYIISE